MTRSRGILQPRRKWSDLEVETLGQAYPDAPARIIASVIDRPIAQVYQKANSLGLKKSAEFLASPMATRLRRGGEVGKAHRFAKGQTPANKGLRRPGWAPGRMAANQFRKGQRPHTWKPVGYERITKDGYLERKVAEPKEFRGVHRIVWESVHGPTPAGHAVAFRPGRKSTVAAEITIDALELVSRAELMRRNTVHNLPKELALVVQLKGALQRQINKRSKP